MQKLLLVTTVKDLSLPFFYTLKIGKKYQIKTILYSENFNDFQKAIASKSCDLVYLRDPFNAAGYNAEDVRKKIEYVLNEQQGKYIDNIKSADDIFIEDKWIQYQVYKEFLPQTQIYTGKKPTHFDDYIIKKRISSRSRDIHFNVSEVTENAQEYIVQEKVKVDEEYRVLAVRGNVVPQVAIKSGRLNSSTANKVIGTEPIAAELSAFVEELIGIQKYDLVGYDIVRTADKQLRLIEVNRSPQFSGFYTATGVNLAELLLS